MIIHEIIYNDLDDQYCDILEKEEELEYNRFFHDEKYKDNGVQIIACAEDLNYAISTEKYNIYWYICGTMLIYNSNKLLLEFKIPFDMKIFAQIKCDDKPGNLEFLYSSADMVNKKIESFLNLRAFI